MNASEPGRLSRFFAALGALGALLVAAPLLLITATRARFDSSSPVAGVAAPWRWSFSGIADAVRNPLTDEVVVNLIVRTCLVVAWIAILVIAVTTVLEAVHLVRHRGITMPSVRGLGGAQHVARFIAAGLLVILPLMSPKASLASPGSLSSIAPAAAVDDADNYLSLDAAASTSVSTHDRPTAKYRTPTVDTRTRPDDQIFHSDSQAPARAPRIHVVQHGESVYGIAEAIAAESSLTTTQVADAVLDANLGTEMVGGQRFTNPAYIEIGWELVIPAEVLPRTSASSSVPHVVELPADSSAEPGDSIEDPSDASHIVHIVEPGETLSGIADEHLGNADEWPVIWAENQGGDMGGGRSFDDPHLILPGWEVEVPAASAEQTPDGNPSDVHADPIPNLDDTGNDSSDTASGETGDDAIEPGSPGDQHLERDSALPSTGAELPAGPSSTPGKPSVADAPATIDASAPKTSASATPSTTSVPPAGATPDNGADTAQQDSTPGAPSPLRIEHAALLAAGILTLVGVRRRQRLRAAMPRARVPEPPPEVVATERRLRTIDSGERSTRVDVAIRAAAHCLVDSDAQVGLVIVNADGEIEIRLTAPARLNAPWTTRDGDIAATWALPASVPIEMLSEDARRVGTPCVALVQLGVSDGRDVLIDLEACGTLAIDAAPLLADEVVTAIAAGLASSPYAEVAHLVGVSLPVDALLGHRNRHRTASVGASFELAVALTGTTMTQDRTSFSLRSLRTGGEMWEPAIILLSSDDSEDLQRVESALPQPGHGWAVVAAVDSDTFMDAPVRLTAKDDGWVLTAFGCPTSITPVGVSTEELAQVVEVLADADAALIVDNNNEDQRPIITTRESIAIAADAASEHSDQPAGFDPFEPMGHDIVVRLMGGVEIASHAGDLGTFERSKTVELIAWLATHREKSTRTAARTALWELDVRDATFANVVSEARRALARLVEPVAEEEWLARTLTEQLPLHTSVVTDAQLMAERLAEARLQPPAQAVVTLRPAAEMIRDMPFAGTSYLWPDAEGITSNLVLLATGVTTELAAHALSLGDTDLVFWATGRGLIVLPGHEELIGLRMRAHARAGDRAGVRQEWESYERVIVADAWSDGEPAPKLLALRRELLTSTT